MKPRLHPAVLCNMYTLASMIPCTLCYNTQVRFVNYGWTLAPPRRASTLSRQAINSRAKVLLIFCFHVLQIMLKMRPNGVNCAIHFYILIIYFVGVTFATHPMLYFSANDVSKLRHKAKTTHVKIAKIIEEAGRSLKEDPKAYLPPESYKSFASRWNEMYGNNLCAFAMYCVLYPEDRQALELVSQDNLSFSISFNL